MCADYLPVYFQAVKGHSPVHSGIDMLELSLTIAPVAYVCRFHSCAHRTHPPGLQHHYRRQRRHSQPLPTAKLYGVGHFHSGLFPALVCGRRDARVEAGGIAVGGGDWGGDIVCCGDVSDYGAVGGGRECACVGVFHVCEDVFVCECVMPFWVVECVC